MGVHGLKHLIQWHHKSCLSSRSLHGCRLLIDGNNLAYLLYTRAPGICSPLGGDYDKFAAHVAYFFARLQQCNIEATVLMDGGQPRDNVKLHTCTTRLQVTINTCMDLKPSQGGYIRVFPLHARSVFLSVLKRIGVLVIQCDFEADHDIAYLARRYKAKVLSNDSDFFLYNVDYVLLDSLKYNKLKKKVDRQGVERWSIPCKMFLKETFLGQCRLQPHHLGLIAALCGNDCVPSSYLKEFHDYLKSGRRRREGHTKRQNLIQLVMAFLARQGGGGTTEVIIEKVVQRVRSDFRGRLRSLLLMSATSYRPASSDVEQDVLTGWRIRKKLREECEGSNDTHQEDGTNQKDESKMDGGRNNKMNGSDVRKGDSDLIDYHENDVNKEERSPNGKKQKLGQSNQQKRDKTSNVEEANECAENKSRLNLTTKNNKGDEEGQLVCDCAERWLGLIELPGDDILLKSLAVSDADCGEEEAAEGMEVDSSAESDSETGAGRVRMVGDTEEEEEEEGDEEEEDDVVNGVCDENEREDNANVSDLTAEEFTGDQVAEEVVTSQPEESCEVSKETEAAPVRNWETMSKKQRKKEMERLKHQERMNRKLNKKAEALEIEILSRKEKPSDSFDITGMDANQIIKTLEMKQKGLLVQNEFEGNLDTEGNESYPLLSDMTLSSCLDEQPGDDSSCPHGRSSLVTSYGYRLPSWLMYGYRHCCVTREISDVVSNNFCISPPQVEDMESESSYRATEKLMKLIMVLARGGGTDTPSDNCDVENNVAVVDSVVGKPEGEGSAEKKRKRKKGSQRRSMESEGGGSDAHDRSLQDDDLTDAMVDIMASSSRSPNKKKKQRKRKNDETLRWFIRDGDDLLIEEIILKKTFDEFSHVPSLSYINTLNRHDRKVVFLRAVFGNTVNSNEILSLPQEFQTVMLFICYWYKNCLSPVNEKHVLSVLLTLVMFYVVCGKINRSRETVSGVACVHCVLKQCDGYKAAGEIKNLVAALACNKNAYHTKKYKLKAKGNKKVQTKRESRTELLEITDDEEWDRQTKTSTTSSKKSTAPSSDEKETKPFASAADLSYLFSTLSEEECFKFDERMSGFHNSYNIDNANFDIEFVHSMSEYQACVHYLNLFNGLTMMPFPPIYMEKIWSGTFSFNMYKALCRYGDRLDLLVALLLGADSTLFKIFVHLYSFLKKFLGLPLDVSLFPGMDQNSVIERFLKQSSPAQKRKKKVKQVTKKELVLKKTMEKVEMDVDEHCAILSLSASSAL